MLTSKPSKLRDWGLFLLIALLPTLAVGFVGLRALRNEEAAIRREMRLQLEAAASRVRQSYAVALERLLAGEQSSAPFAETVSMPQQGERAAAPKPSRNGMRDGAEQDACRELAKALRSDVDGREATRRRILTECREARSPGGRMLWPLVALEARSGVSATELAGWLSEFGANLGANERSATRLEIETASWLQASQRQLLLEALRSEKQGGGASAFLATRRLAMRTGKPRIEWNETRSRGLLVRRDSGDYQGFVVHAGSIRRAMRSGWPELPAGMTARLTGGPPKSGVPTVALFAGGAQLLLDWRDPDAVARRTQRSQLILIAAASVALLIAIALAALLFARMRSERRLSSLRTDFVAAVSHELRTPIASIRMLSELLAEDRVEPDERDDVHQALARESRRLGGTVNQLLSFSRMDAGKQIVRRKKVVVADIVAAAIDTFEDRYPDVAPVERQLDETLRAEVDEEALRMAIGNLLSNARKYAPDGGPYGVEVRADDDGLRIAVSDAGPGIAASNHRRIFRPFERADDRLSEATEGSGIGLSLVQHVAHSHGGSVRLESKLGEGATFIMWIPSAAAE